jgi:exodeoxyribonuclease VII large subunit
VEQLNLILGGDRRFLTVTEFTEMLRGMLEEVFPDIWISGEISGVKSQPSGHIYFTLKDGEAIVNCVCYRSAARYLRFKPRDGVAVLARGRVDIWPPSGRYQLIVEAIEPQGKGALQVAFEQLKKKLSEEGLFDQARKRPLPALPRRIGIVTSPTGAVIQDLLRILETRFAGLAIRIYPAAVQGEGSVEQVCRGIDYFSRSEWAEVVIVARGGGSLEDLWTFNEEAVARAIASSSVPVISAIGHETDFTIADFVADLRAATPSAAADLVIQSKSRLQERFAHLQQRLGQVTQYRLAQTARRLHKLEIARPAAALRRRIGRLLQRGDEYEFRLRSRVSDIIRIGRRRLEAAGKRLRDLDVRVRVVTAKQRREMLETRLQTAMKRTLESASHELERLDAHVTQLSPLRILDRGYALVATEQGQLVTSPNDVIVGSNVNIRVSKGSLRARVVE